MRSRCDRSAALLLVLGSSLSVASAGCDGGKPHTSSGSAHNPPTVPGTVAVPVGVGDVYTANERGGSISRLDLTHGPGNDVCRRILATQCSGFSGRAAHARRRLAAWDDERDAWSQRAPNNGTVGPSNLE